MLLLILTLAPLSTGEQLCRPPDVREYTGCDSGPCTALGSFIAEPVRSAGDAAVKLASLLPAQASSAQLVILSRSNTTVLVWRSSAAERVERAGVIQPIAVTEYKLKALGSRDAALQSAAGHFSIDFLLGTDVALVSTNVPGTPFLVIAQTSGECQGEKRRAVRR